MEISNEDYIREIQRFLKPPDFLYYIDNKETYMMIYYSPSRGIYFNLSDMKSYMNKLYGMKITYEKYDYTYDYIVPEINTITITFPSSYEELYIINDLKGN